MGATLTLPHAIDTFYRGNPVTDADAFARAFAPDATLEFIGPHAPRDEKGENVVIPAGELRATMANMIAGFSNFTVRDADAPQKLRGTRTSEATAAGERVPRVSSEKSSWRVTTRGPSGGGKTPGIHAGEPSLRCAAPNRSRH